jgi:hypothetical protein
MDAKSAAILGGCTVAAALVLSLVARSTSGSGAVAARGVPDTGSGGAGPVMQVRSPEGNLAVDFQIQTSSTTWEGSKIANVSDIEFYAGYVVVKTTQGSGMIFYNERTRSLSWSQTKR